jgi:hypothetical protein
MKKTLAEEVTSNELEVLTNNQAPFQYFNYNVCR